jgi:hypothetical protein
MKVSINREENTLNCRTVTISTENKEFIIQVDKFGNLVINKQNYGEGESSIVIIPRVSNEIHLS